MRAGLPLLPILTLIITACTPAGGPTAQTGQSTGNPNKDRVLTVSIESEPNFIAAVVPIAGLAATAFYQRMFNATLDFIDGQGKSNPYLVEALPALNTDTWAILPDGRMETRYRLKPNLTWHDGHPLSAEDIAFAFKVATPANGFRTGITPYSVMEEVVASDDRSFVIRWRGLYPDAGVLVGGGTRFGLVPFPRHLLEQPYADQSKEAFQDNLYWSHDFVGAGPYKLVHWELGSYIEAVAFEQHVLGRAKIERVRLMFMADPNTAFANMLAGTTDVALNSITFEHMLQLKREWTGTNRGVGDYTATSLTAVNYQLRPDYVNPRAILDPRVRRALAQGIDKKTFGETVWGGELQMMDSIFEPTTEYYSAIDRLVTKYPYDPRASERLMNEAGYTKGSEGFYAGPDGKLNFLLVSGPSRPELPVLAANWRQAGFDMAEQELSRTASMDNEVRSSFPALSVTTSGAYENQQMQLFRANEIASADNRWRGENRTGWANPEYERLVEAFNTTMDPKERVTQRAQMAQILTQDLPALNLSYNANPHAFLNSVKGIARTALTTTGRVTWNITDWEFTN